MRAGVRPAFDLSRLWEPPVQPADVMMFSRQLHTLLRAGVPPRLPTSMTMKPNCASHWV